MTSLLRGVYIVGAKRTPFGAMGGKLKDHTPTKMAVVAGKAALESAGVKPENVDVCVGGIVNQAAAKDTPYCSRHVALHCGLPQKTPSLNVNRLCGSGFQAAVNGVQMECSLLATLTDMYCKLPMAITAENLADKYKISRQDVDHFALRSQKRWAEANKAGRFKEEIVPIPIKVKGKEVLFDTDEHPRPDSTIDSLAKLPALFKKDGTVTAGNASGICDGAGAIVVASEDAVKKHNLKPLARIVGYSYVGVDPTIMGIGPVPAIRQLCEKTGVKLQDLDLVDVNEAFASQFLAVEKELGVDPEKSNVNGGAVALGHPVGASGARILANITYELRHRKGKYAVGSACIGGGQGIAVMIENV
ncbi:yippee interacting protein 2 isoform X2 [Dermacentor variabilis]|uniref:yippee interacting protein 2 isoform X2 n=1 Tax=Dermacentor variabilis TaxID=34621 RepID=UPI003F5B61F8